MAPPAVSHEAQRERRRGQLFVALAAIAWSTAGVLQRELSVDTATQLAGRALFAFFALLAFVTILNRGRPFGAFRSMGVAGLAVFDGPTRAVRAAQSIAEGARSLGLEVRAGVHTGEVEVDGDAVRRIAVHVAARVCASAGAGDLYVSSTVRDLAAGAGLEYEDRGLHELKGVPEPRQLFAVVR